MQTDDIAGIGSTPVVIELAAEYGSAATRLIEAGQASLGALVVCCGIDMFAALYAGRANYGNSEDDFVGFVARYMPMFASPVQAPATKMKIGGASSGPPLRLAWKGAQRLPIGTFAQVLYRGYRCGLVHQGQTSAGTCVVDHHTGPVFVYEIEQFNGDRAYRMSLNVRPFRDAFIRGVHQYAGEMERGNELRARFMNRWQFVTGPQWELVEP